MIKTPINRNKQQLATIIRITRLPWENLDFDRDE